jgi:4-aminobutyrate aminotransferase-like enzyme
VFSGGAEAVSGLRLAKATTGNKVIGFWGGFHGKTGGVPGLLGSDFKHHLGPFLPGQHLTPYADCYRCPLRLTYPACGIACAEYVRDVIRYQTAGEIAAIIVEPSRAPPAISSRPRASFAPSRPSRRSTARSCSATR